MNEIKISVVIPTYKRPGLLQKCLHQLQNQNLKQEVFEILVVSDGPDADSEKVVNEFVGAGLSNLRFLSLRVKSGPAAARNMGWKSARAALIAFTDDDCLPQPDWLASILAVYENEVAIAYTGKVIVPVSESPTDFELNTKGLETGDFVTANCVVTRAALEAIGGIDEAFTAAWREDSDLEFKLLKKKVPIVKVGEAVVVHPVRSAPWGISLKEQKKTMYNALLYKKYPDLFRQRIKSRPSWRYYLIILFFAVFLVSAALHVKMLMMFAIAGWVSLTSAFIAKRLSASRKSTGHVLEMIVTSALIPFLSVYWTLYGAIKYRVLFF